MHRRQEFWDLRHISWIILRFRDINPENPAHRGYFFRHLCRNLPLKSQIFCSQGVFFSMKWKVFCGIPAHYAWHSGRLFFLLLVFLSFHVRSSEASFLAGYLEKQRRRAVSSISNDISQSNRGVCKSSRAERSLRSLIVSELKLLPSISNEISERTFEPTALTRVHHLTGGVKYRNVLYVKQTARQRSYRANSTT